MSEADAVLLVAFGGPENPEDVRPFLRIVSEGRAIPPARLEAVAHHYEVIGGRSPLNELTRRQAAGLRCALGSTPVYVGMRNWHPFLADTLARMRDDGCRRAVGIILSPFQAEASWDRYVADVARAREAVGAGAPEIAFAPPWGDHPRFIDAMADRVTAALAGAPAAARAAARLVFTAHSVPEAMAAGSLYADQFRAASGRVAGRVAHGGWSIAYQSRSGSPRDPWLGPDVGDELRRLARDGARDAVVAPIGFVADNFEVLYDLDVEARQIAEASGLRFHRALAANDHPLFVALLADLARGRAVRT